MNTQEEPLATTGQVLSELAELAGRHDWQDIGRQAADLAANLEHLPETVLLIGPEALSPEEREALAAGHAQDRLIDLGDEALGGDGAPVERLAEGCRVGLVLRAGRLISPEIFKLIVHLRVGRPAELLLLAFTGARELDEADRERAELAAWRLLEPDRPFMRPSSQADGNGPCFLDSTAGLSTWLRAQPDAAKTAAMRRLQVAALLDAAERVAEFKAVATAPAAVATADSPVVMRRLKEDYRLLSRQIATSHETLLLDLPQAAESGTALVRTRLESWARETAELAGRWWSRGLEELRAENLMPDEDALPPDFHVALPPLSPPTGDRDSGSPTGDLLGPAATGAALGGGALLCGAILLSRIVPIPLALTATAATSAGLVGGAWATSVESHRRQRHMAVQQQAQQAAALARTARTALERRVATAEETLSALLRRASREAGAPYRGPADAGNQESPQQQLGQLRNRLFDRA